MASTATVSGRQRALGLYRSILRAHKRCLPPEMKQLGDTYVQSEFKLHKTAKPEHLTAFFREWESYVEELLKTARTRDLSSMVDPVAQTTQAASFGRDLPKDMQLQEEQRAQLELLRREAEKLGNTDK
ncbi:dehydrogenase assembly factor 3, mitochondrial [Seminavis robusta]|uniref:Succinate dehydrogenase assembly factor 3 n=1 Tax=Seminavis robusta TaxID=568900 RepID=A0A9N8H684_9STRA|nr:dehydrogenase assembly factor 3, mitochondrial [Seminavis robusta]|eukprot:Sro93_g048280.1 dehydrogenase assembly factor 3, mitochondrial (128) ;mRNA; f:10035-10418